MRAHVLDEHNKIINTISVDALTSMPGLRLISAESGGSIGDTWDGQKFTPKQSQISAPSRLDVESAIQSSLDTYAQSWGYNDIASACTYINDPCTKFHNEASALRKWRSDTWQAVEAIDAQIAAGTHPYPQTIAEALSQLPAPPARPQ